MHLKALVLKGFKSFADRSVLTLEPGVSAIVGPNGSGKSNISDAVLWVLGERNAKNLRGQVMEDVIFAGSSARKSVGMAEVELVLDNADGTLPVEYREVSIARRMYRNGESDYLINGSVVRRMDVLDILHDSGLGTGTHSIIAQGHLDGILQSKPEDRRALIEEAAGVLKHKQRKEKSQRKLEQMDVHLARVNDVVSEVTRQLGPLERKAKRAVRYREESARLAQLDLQLAVDDLRTLQGTWEAAKKREGEQQEALRVRQEAIAAAEESAESILNAAAQRNAAVMGIAAKQRRAQSCAERLRSASALLDERGASAAARIEDLERSLQDQAAKREAVFEQYDEAQAFSEALDRTNALDARAEDVQLRLAEAKEAHSQRSAAVAASKAKLAEFTEREQGARAGLEELQKAVDGARTVHDAALDACQALASERKGLQGMERAASAAAGAARAWVVEHNAGLSPLTSVIRVDEDYESLVEQLIGDDISSLVAQGREDVSRIGRDLADRKKHGKVVLLLENTPAAAVVARDAAERVRRATASEESRFIALIDKVSYPPSLQAAIASIVGDLVVCECIEDALVASAIVPEARFATRDGAVCKGGKAVFGAAVVVSRDGALARSRRLAELDDLEAAAAQEAARAKEALDATRARLEESRKAVFAVSEELARLRGVCKADEREERSSADRVKSFERELASIDKQKEQVAQQAEAYAARIAQNRANELDRLARAEYQARKTIYEKRIAGDRVLELVPLFDRLRAAAAACAERLEKEAQESNRATAEGQKAANAARAAVRDARAAYDAQNSLLSDTRIEIGRLEVQVDGAINVIVRDCKTPMETAIALPLLEDRPGVEQEAFKLRRSIANMGTINPDAAAEFEALRDRSDFLNGQLQDLKDARASLARIDRYIDKRMREDFQNTFAVVNENFTRIFESLFPGGAGHLELVDPSDMENTGVEVVAQPHGKKITKMTLMSGGEKSLVALALLFAVYATRSTPFYILDEVEAALDDSNLRRLLAYLEDLRKTTQLIMITHQRRTMEMADTLFGVSMQADGVTKVVSQKLDRALQYAE